MLRNYLRKNFLLAMLSIGALCIAPALAQPQSWAQAGMLRCNLNPSIGFVIFGHQSMECKFQPVSGPVQAYEAEALFFPVFPHPPSSSTSPRRDEHRRSRPRNQWRWQVRLGRFRFGVRNTQRRTRRGICRGLWRYRFGGRRRRQRPGGRLKSQRRFAARLP